MPRSGHWFPSPFGYRDGSEEKRRLERYPCCVGFYQTGYRERIMQDQKGFILISDRFDRSAGMMYTPCGSDLTGERK